jgi:hypothetical protein
MYDPKAALQSVTGLNPKSQEVGMRNSRMKTISTALFDAECIIHQEFMPETQTVNRQIYREMLKRLIARVHCVTLEFQESGSWYLLH